MTRPIIGIDPGTSCGWAVLDADGNRVASGAWDLRSRRHEGGGMRYVRCRRYLSELLDAYPDALVAYEEVRRHAGMDAAHVYGGIISHVAAICEERGVPYQSIPVGTIKKLATGKGNAGKPAMVAAAVEQWGHKTETDDEADALGCAETLRESVGAVA